MNEALRRAIAPFGFDDELLELAAGAFEEVGPAWRKRDAQAAAVGAKVIACFVRAGLHEAHLAGTTGYGYHDSARDAYESLLAACLDAQASYARLQLISGTHAIVAAINALLGPTGRLCSVTGAPYDTLRLALVKPLLASASGNDERYSEVALQDDGSLDEYGINHALARLPDVVFVQRSRGYAPRPALGIGDIERIVRLVRNAAPAAIIVVDNCYGEFVEEREPTAVGVDLIIGSLIKNPGGGLAPAGAYIAGRTELLDAIACAIVAPGLGRNVGPTLDTPRLFFAGLHRAPKVVAESLKIMDFAAALFAKLGYQVDPQPGAARYDIIQAINLGEPGKLVAFAHGLQTMLPVNARARPEPGPVPGYDDPVVMAAGSFINGSTIELSCDAPMRPPFTVYLQGGMDATHGVIAVLAAARAVRDRHSAGRGVPYANSPQDMAENLQRRQYVRTVVSLPVTFTLENNGGRHEGAVVDLGEGGMRLVSDKHAPARSTVRLAFTLDGGHEIRARGRVVLSYYSAPEQKYHHGVAFTSIDRDDRSAIAHFVQSQVASS
ncbi:MAG: methionine gamma-lyase family protein [Candidatus Eremiobacteraeota bacterium]|nr:methionine gamma-lyase family protein [Candidatus Eremiobacteraeota bacterium]